MTYRLQGDVRDMPGGAHYDSTGKMVYVYTVAMNTADGVREDNDSVPAWKAGTLSYLW